MAEYWFNDISDETKTILEIGYELDSLARAFQKTGNDGAYNLLQEMSTDLLEAQKKIQGAVGKHCHEDFERSEEATKNMVLAALASIAPSNNTEEEN